MEMFEEMIEESYAGFGTSSHLQLNDLRYMYYGRKDLYISFTDDGDYIESGLENRPKGIIGYKMNDVVGHKVRSPEFYANVFRWYGPGALPDVRRYTGDDFVKDYRKLTQSGKYDIELLNELFVDIGKNVLIRHPFSKLWEITEQLATRQRKNTEAVWAEILMDLGYTMIGDPAAIGILSDRYPAYLFLDTERRIDVDILPIQKYRVDPRLRTRQKVERKLKYMRNTRKRIAKYLPENRKKMTMKDLMAAISEMDV